MNIWFSSDFHFNHKNIVRGTSEWGDTKGQMTRPFDTLDHHNHVLIQNINNSVKEQDILYFLGDWSFGGINSIWEFRKQLNVKNIHFVIGNHDHHIENDKLLPNVPKEFAWSVYNAQSLFSSVQHVINKNIGGQRMYLSHFASRVWDKSHHGSWNLYGHSHGTLSEYGPESNTDKYKAMDVGIDTHPEFRPYHFDEIAKIMNTRIALQADHHNRETN